MVGNGKEGESIKGSYGLHDSIIKTMQFKNNRLTLKFKNGIAKMVEDDSIFVPGKVIFYDVDPDFCHVYIIDRFKNSGKFKGRKWELHKFIKKHQTLNMEVISVTTSGYATMLSGIIWDGKKYTDREFFLDLYYTGGMEYIEKKS